MKLMKPVKAYMCADCWPLRNCVQSIKSSTEYCQHSKGRKNLMKPVVIRSLVEDKAREAVIKAADDIGFPPLYRSLDGHKGTIKALHIALAKLKELEKRK
jgi:hypothetical protein